MSSRAADFVVKSPRLGTSLEGQRPHSMHHHGDAEQQASVASTLPANHGEASGFSHMPKTKTISESQADGDMQVVRRTEELQAEYNQLVLSDNLTCEKFDTNLRYCQIRVDTSKESIQVM